MLGGWVAFLIVSFLVVAVTIGRLPAMQTQVDVEIDPAAAMSRFLEQFEGRRILVLKRRRGWYDFVRNNVLPVIPPTVTVVWLQPPALRNSCSGRELDRILGRLNLPRERPLLVSVANRQVKVQSLFEALEPLRDRAAPSAEAKELIWRAIARYFDGA